MAFALFVVGYGALLAAWVVGNPLGRAPDEPAHYVKTLAVGSGDLVGQRVPPAPVGLTASQRAWMGAAERLFVLPSRLALIPNLPCNASDPTLSAACQRGWPPRADRQQPTYVGSYQPYAYVAPGLAMRLGRSPWSAWILGRATFALLALGLIVLGLLALGTSPITSAALALAVTPMVVFLASTLNPSGLETARTAMPDVILLDVMMPGLDGWQVAEELLDDESTSGIPIVFLTARAELRDRARGLDVGGIDYVTKPFNPIELASLVRELLSRVERGEREDLRREKLSQLRDSMNA